MLAKRLSSNGGMNQNGVSTNQKFYKIYRSSENLQTGHQNQGIENQIDQKNKVFQQTQKQTETENELQQIQKKDVNLTDISAEIELDINLEDENDQEYINIHDNKNKKLGKRKSYVVPIQYLLGIFLFFLSFQFEEIIQTKNIDLIVCFSIFVIFLLSIQDIAVDGWSVKLLYQENVSYATFMQSFGQFIGGIISGNLYILLNSKKWVKENLGLDEALLNPQNSLIFISFLLFAGTFYIHFFKPENPHKKFIQPDQESDEDKDQQTLKETLKKLKYFFQNKNLRFLLIFLFTKSLGFDAIDQIAGQYLLGKEHLNYPRELFSTVQLWLKPWSMIVAFIAAHYSRKKIEFSIYIKMYCLKFVSFVFTYFLLKNFSSFSESGVYWNLLLISALDIFIGNMIFIGIGTFFLRQCDVQNAGIFMTFLNSFSNFGGLWTGPLYLNLLTYLGLDGLFILGFIIAVVYILYWKNRLLYFQRTSKLDWALSEKFRKSVL
ncbi:Major facilitator superfamily domain, general substrate transporter [Pseudocohnilembus persalinus]|uniref:Major facilitator superfamily domain, general substrate transporter n=1 Tax=Pseudocohnilembus persalinus TaxID=266149 RepID=A0A0V0R0G5_PSEPJ|nr:Major facilitator superfamily domain, general substrate transporter [Pseudocohnilembus persalinus]|eukprot:KRX07998.1 Major facilitator superfamily domain, general substrate transporter [Pseudocohnilembus persalinus]